MNEIAGFINTRCQWGGDAPSISRSRVRDGLLEVATHSPKNVSRLGDNVTSAPIRNDQIKLLAQDQKVLI